MESLWTGMSGTGHWDDDHRPKDWDQKYSQLFPNGKAMLSEILSLMGSEKTIDPEFNWWEDELAAQGGAVAGVYEDAALSIAYTAGDDYSAGSVLYVKLSADTPAETAELSRRFRPGLEVMLREENDFTNDLVCKVIDVVEQGASSYVAVRLLMDDGSGAGDASDADYICVVGDVNAQGGFPVESRVYERSKFTNYTQIFKESYTYTRTAGDTTYNTGDKKKWLQADALRKFTEQREKAYLWGVKSSNTNADTGMPEYTTGGIMSFLKSGAPDHVQAFHLDTDTRYASQTFSAVGKTFMDEALERLFHYSDGSMGRKICLCGNGAVTGLNQLAGASSTFNMTVRTTSFGWSVWNYRSPFGDIDFLTYPLFNLYTSLSNSMLFLEPHLLKRKYMLKNKGPKDVTPVGMDGKKYEFIAEDGLKIMYPKTMMFLSSIGVTNQVSA